MAKLITKQSIGAAAIASPIQIMIFGLMTPNTAIPISKMPYRKVCS
jgi:hypothetical protein